MSSIAPVTEHGLRLARAARVAVLVGCGVALAGCTGAIETVRSLRGINKNDPDPVTAPFTGNIAAAEAESYPNLASVPAPPTRATTVAERQKLTENLIAQRAAAQAFAAASPGAQPTAGQPANPRPTNAQPANPQPANPQPANTPPAPAKEAPAAAPPEAAPVAAHAAATTPRPASAHAAASNDIPGPHRGKSGEPEEAPPRDSELRMPQVRSLPEPDAPRPAPASPRLAALPSPASTGPPPVAIASAIPQPPPAVPEIAPIAPPATPDLGKPAPPNPAGAKTEPPRAPAATTVAMLDALDPAQLDPARITQVAARYKERMGLSPPLRAVRVIAYTAPPAPGADPLGAYHDALERGQGIAKMLTEAGIPAKMIQTEAKPTPGPLAAARVEIQFLP
jgi:hypothetical protein